MYARYDLNLNNLNQLKFIKSVGTLKLYELSETQTDIVINNITICPTTSQLLLRKIINEQIGVKRNPWCYVQNMLSNNWNINNLSIDALYWWKVYSAEPKIIAFKGLIPFGFRAVSIYDKIIFKRRNGYDEEQFKNNIKDFYKQCLPWSDRFNKPYVDLDDNGHFIS